MSDYDSIHLLPAYSELASRSEVSPIVHLGKGRSCIPVMAAPMSTVSETDMGLALSKHAAYTIIHRYMSPESQYDMVTRIANTGGFAGAAFSSSDKDRTRLLASADIDILMGDVAHGDSKAFYEAVRAIRESGFAGLVASANIVTVDGARRSVDAGCDLLRVGIGAGSVCETRAVAGVGRNTLRAIREIHAEYPDTPIIACGGIRSSGDIVKCLASGASAVLVGRLLATTDESPAPRLGSKVVYAGMASYFAEELRAKETTGNAWRQEAPEGRHELLDSTGPVGDTIKRLVGGIRAGCAYVGARSIPELWEKARFEDV